LPSHTSFRDLRAVCCKTFGRQDLAVCYQDDEHDLVRLDSDEELQEAMRVQGIEPHARRPFHLVCVADQQPNTSLVEPAEATNGRHATLACEEELIPIAPSRLKQCLEQAFQGSARPAQLGMATPIPHTAGCCGEDLLPALVQRATDSLLTSFMVRMRTPSIPPPPRISPLLSRRGAIPPSLSLFVWVFRPIRRACLPPKLWCSSMLALWQRPSR
jgi:hypothetical protein